MSGKNISFNLEIQPETLKRDKVFVELIDLFRSRARQLIQMSAALKEFALQHKVPPSCAIVLAGDLNCLDMKRLSSVGNVVTWLCGTIAHNFFYNPMIIETYSTSTTLVRDVQIDYIVYAKGSLSLKEVHPIPRSPTPIPNKDHPSDHYPVTVSFYHHDAGQFRLLAAERFIENVLNFQNGNDMEHLSIGELEGAFKFFVYGKQENTDSNPTIPLSANSGTIAIATEKFDLYGYDFLDLLVNKGVNTSGMISFLDDKISKLFSRKTASKSKELFITFEMFSKLYYSLEFYSDMPDSSIYNAVFDFFDTDKSKLLEDSELRRAIESVSGKPLVEKRFKQVKEEMDTNNDGKVSREEFLTWIHRLHKKIHLRQLED